ncbi:MAG TPA: WYL domain-containing protein [Acidimicrobiales bacterium]|nr:WYL domain-containing protein [Acidimicrobiales bacterium]
MRADRLLALMLLLQARGRTTAAALAAELEVSVRTVYRDLQALSAAGVPVFAEAGPGGGCQLLPGYRSPLDALSPEEADALLILGAPAALRQLGLGDAADAARHRVTRSTAGRPTRPAPLVHLDLPRWFHPAEETPHLADLARAVRGSLRVTMDYRSDRSRGARSHTAEPLGLVNKAGAWYLVATTGRDPVVFRVGRIAAVEVTTERFRRPPAFDLESFWAAWSQDFAGSRPRLPVAARVSGEGMRVLPEVLGDAVRPALEAAGPADGDGWRPVQLEFESLEAAAYRLIGLAGIVEVVGPPEVRRRMALGAERALQTYGR